MPKLAPGEYGLVAHPFVQWLLQNESEVLNSVKRFIADRAERAHFDVAGPPSLQDVKRSIGAVPLPCIRLHLRLIKGNLTGDPGIEVTCSERDIDEIGRWRMLAALRKTSPGNLLRA